MCALSVSRHGFLFIGSIGLLALAACSSPGSSSSDNTGGGSSDASSSSSGAGPGGAGGGGGSTGDETITLLATNIAYPRGLAVDETSIYYANTTNEMGQASHGSLLRVAKTGGEPVALESDLDSVGYFALEGTSIYYAVRGDYQSPTGTIRKVEKTGGAVTTVASAQRQPTFLSVQNGTVYFTNYGTSQPNNVYNFDGQLVSAPAAGGAAPSVLLSNMIRPMHVVAMDTYLFYYSAEADLHRTALDGTGDATFSIAPTFDDSVLAVLPAKDRIVWRTELSIGTLALDAPDGSAGTILASAGNQVGEGLFVDGSTVYFGDAAGIQKVSIDGGPTSLVVAGAKPVSLAVDDEYVYWMERTGSDVTTYALRRHAK